MEEKQTSAGFLSAIAAILVVSIAFLIFIDPIPQDPFYHAFIDSNPYFGVPNFWNVLSNLGFCLVGILGVTRALNTGGLSIIQEVRFIYVFFFISIFLVGIGSGYYHLNPNNQTLVWDRLPMTLGFMTLVSIVVAEHQSVTWAKRVLPLSLMLGACSVVYWDITESLGKGDLRYYAIVQFGTMLLIPTILLTTRSKFDSNIGYWALALFYFSSKALEYLDTPIFESLYWISGHSLKHISASVGIYFLYRHYCSRHLFKSTGKL